MTSCHPRTSDLQDDQRWLEELAAHIDSVHFQEEEPDTVRFAEESEATAPVPPNQVVASIQKTPCFGRCPVFEVRIYANGKAVYNGERFSPRIGVFEAEVTEQALEELMASVSSADFNALSPEYPANGRKIPDLPSTITYIRTDDFEKRIFNNHDAPQELIDFERLFLEWIENLPWQAIPKD